MVEAHIVHHNGSGTVEDFQKIEELDNGDDLRVWYSDPDGEGMVTNYEDYYLATVTEVKA